MNKPLRIGILAGESSGDILGADLMRSLLQKNPTIQFEGIGGPLMETAGLHSRFPMERLSVMGLVEPLKRLPELLRIRKSVIQHFSRTPPDVFIGIDSPDFNLTIETRLREKGIKTVHYVSPSVWAWRQKRLKKISKAVDLVLALFPFEADFYTKHAVPVCYVGHPLAEIIPEQTDVPAAKLDLGFTENIQIMALLPGSRQSEIERLAPLFFATARLCVKARPGLKLILPCINQARKAQLQSILAVSFPDLPVTLLDGQSRLAMAASDAILIASGTATLEAMLLKKPMLVCYRMASLSYAIISRMLKVPYFSLPNLLAGKLLVKELVQDQLKPAVMATEMLALLEGNNAELDREYLRLHQELKQDASNKAAAAVLDLIG